MGLVKKSRKVITDSGGLQKEAYFAGKQAIVVMPDTGWKELVDADWNRLLDVSRAEKDLPDLVFDDLKSRYCPGIYGNGDAGKKIADVLRNN